MQWCSFVTFCTILIPSFVVKEIRNQIQTHYGYIKKTLAMYIKLDPLLALGRCEMISILILKMNQNPRIKHSQAHPVFFFSFARFIQCFFFFSFAKFIQCYFTNCMLQILVLIVNPNFWWLLLLYYEECYNISTELLNYLSS